MASATTERPVAGTLMRRWIAAVLVAAVTLSVTAYAAVSAVALAAIGAARPGALLNERDPTRRLPLDALTDRQVRIALAASPLLQRTVNVAMMRAVQRGDRIEPWISQVSRLGWRDTTSLQNKLYLAARRGDIATVLDTSDALLRRRNLTEQIIPVLSLVETDRPLRAIFIDRLAASPNWRALYLTTTAHLQRRDQLVARYEVVRGLQRKSVRLDRSEVDQNIRALDRGGLPDYGFALWQSKQPGVTRPLDDTRFVRASQSFQSDAEPLPYQWQMASGEGFGAGASTENGSATLDIDWNGRGVPVFASQRTSALPGSYALDVSTALHKTADLAALVFRLQCGDQTVALRQDARLSTRFVTERPVPCSYPVLQIAGDIQPSATPHHLTIQSIVMQRVRNPG